MRSSIRFSFVSTIAFVAASSGGCDSSDPGDPPIQYPEEEGEGEGEDPAAAPLPFTAATVPVVVTNTTAQPVPTKAVGTTTVAGAVAATQAGNWDVNVAGGTVGASQSGPWSVGAKQEGAWSVSAKQEGPWTVDIGSSPPVSLAPGSSVSVGSMPPVTIAGVPAVNIANTPAVSIASMPAVAVSGTVLIGNTEDDEAIPVRNVGGGGGGGSEATQTPWIGGGQVILGAGEDSDSTLFFTVPAGKRLVIEHMTIDASVPAGQIVLRAMLQTTVTGSLSTLRYPLQPYEDGSDTHDHFELVELTKVHVRGGADVIATIQRTDATGIGLAFFALSGYLVDEN